MAERGSRIETLRRRVHQDPASVSFASLAEECRRAGLLVEAIGVCRDGLLHHPTYLSARVTLATCLAATDDLAAARTELETILAAAPDNLVALRTLADVHRRCGEPEAALRVLERALGLAPDDFALAEAIRDLRADLPDEVSNGHGATGPDGESTVLLALETFLVAIRGGRQDAPAGDFPMGLH